MTSIDWTDRSIDPWERWQLRKKWRDSPPATKKLSDGTVIYKPQMTLREQSKADDQLMADLAMMVDRLSFAIAGPSSGKSKDGRAIVRLAIMKHCLDPTTGERYFPEPKG